MRKAASLPVRLDPDTKLRLKNAAEAMGMTVSALIRLLVKSFVEEYDRCGGRISLPPHWKTEPEPALQSALYDNARKPTLRQAAEKREAFSRSAAGQATP